jgi:opacity protein-like surface antigen
MVSTYMFNVILGAPVSGTSGRSVRPYGSAGIGAIHTRVGSDLGLVDVSNTDFGWNAGAGTMGFFSPHVGVQGDVRYFQSLQNDLKDSTVLVDVGRFRFWRVTGGIVIRFGAQ